MTTPLDTAKGLRYSLAAYVWWGLVPMFWRLLRHVPAAESLAHRIVWSCLFVGAFLTFRGGWPSFFAVVRDPSRRRWLIASTAVISLNWFLFIWSVNAGRVTEASLGYYINPLLNILLGRLVLGEKLRPAQLASVVLAAIGVINLAAAVGAVPVVSLALAATFGIYGLLRKQAPIEPLVGLAVETAFIAPVAIAFIVFTGATGTAVLFDSSPFQFLLVVASGAITALPLLWFAIGARNLRLSTMGMLQYLSPTLQLGLAVLAFGEPFTRAHAVTFGLIWTAVIVYAVDGYRAQR